jgi:pentatricopeptide repeat protein
MLTAAFTFLQCAFAPAGLVPQLRKPHSSIRMYGFGSPEPRSVVPRPVPLSIQFEDDDLLVVDKPSGMVVQFSPGSLESAVAAHLNCTDCQWASPSWPWKGERSFEGIVHRLDKGTSGLIAVAKHPHAARALQAAFEERRVHKTYLAIAAGLPSPRASEPAAARQDARLVPDEHISAEQRQLAREIKACGRDVPCALQMLEVGTHTIEPTASCFSAAISVCMRAGEREAALSLLDSMERWCVTPNLQCYRTAIGLCAREPPLWQIAVRLVRRMRGHGLPSSAHCVSSAISACGRAGRLNEALTLLHEFEREGAAPSSECRSAAIAACSRCGQEDVARHLADGAQSEASSFHDSAMVGPGAKAIVVNAPIGRVGNRLMGILPVAHGGREARSHVTTLAFDGALSLNRVVIETGRTHQIRVHLASLGCPLVGDRQYGTRDTANRCVQPGARRPPVRRPMLHAAELVLPHPSNGSALRFECAPPADFASLAETISPVASNII